MKQTRPTFLGIGAQKAGTTWLYLQLSKHPEIWLPPIKEIHFFDRSPLYPTPNSLATPSPFARIIGTKPWERTRTINNVRRIANNVRAGEIRRALWLIKWNFGYYNTKWYVGLFSAATAFKVCGEITPSYSVLNEDDIAQIKALNPDMKLIFMIRDPIERAWSATRFLANQEYSKIDLNSADQIIFTLSSLGTALRSNYERTLDTYLKHFAATQILVCFYDAIACDPLGLMSGITTFLEVSPFVASAIDSQTPINASPMSKMPDEVREYLHETYAPMTKRMAARFGSYATTWNGTQEHPNAFTPSWATPTMAAVVHP
jgi:hypothetical protein